MLLQAPDAARDQDPLYWRARANAIEGFRREDNARSKAKIDVLEGQVRTLTTKNTELVKSHPAAAPTINLADHFSPEELEFFGPERAMVIQRNIAKGNATHESAIAELRAELTELRARTKQSAEDEANEKHRKFIADMDAGFPRWAEVDKDARWLSWLTIPDEHTGIVRQEIVTSHAKAKNAAGIILLLKQFMKTLEAVPVPPVPPVNPATLEGTGGDSPPPPNPGGGDGVFLTEQQIKDGYKRKSLGRMTAEEARLFDARVAAQMAAAGRA